MVAVHPAVEAVKADAKECAIALVLTLVKEAVKVAKQPVPPVSTTLNRYRKEFLW